MKPISCHRCYFYDDGSCTWFNTYGKEKESKLIPENVLNKGCKYYITNKVKHLIEVFDGEIIYEESLFRY